MKLKSTEERIHILDSSSRSNIWPVITEIADNGVQEEAFYVCDIGDIVRKHKNWKASMPRVHPYYAVKCNDSSTVLEILAHMGVNFDCASKGEINKVLNLGVEPSRIVFANPTKVASHIRYACSANVNLTTFDNESELYKIKKFHPKTKLLLRLRCDAEDAQIVLGLKYGCDAFKDAPRLLEIARELDLDVVGVSFHVGSGCREPEAYRRAIATSKCVFDLANVYGYDFDILDIGGGFLGEKNTSIKEIAEIINSALAKYFPSPLVRVIAEPGRYYVSSAFTLACNIYSIRDVIDDSTGAICRKMYYINDGIYSSFNCLLYDHQTVLPTPLHVAPSGVKSYVSSIWGPTCDSLDKVCDDVILPEMKIGDWMVFEDMGAYTMAIASTFNGFPLPKVHLVADEGVWMMLKDVISVAMEMSVVRKGPQ